MRNQVLAGNLRWKTGKLFTLGGCEQFNRHGSGQRLSKRVPATKPYRMASKPHKWQFRQEIYIIKKEFLVDHQIIVNPVFMSKTKRAALYARKIGRASCRERV